MTNIQYMRCLPAIYNRIPSENVAFILGPIVIISQEPAYE